MNEQHLMHLLGLESMSTHDKNTSSWIITSIPCDHWLAKAGCWVIELNTLHAWYRMQKTVPSAGDVLSLIVEDAQHSAILNLLAGHQWVEAGNHICLAPVFAVAESQDVLVVFGRVDTYRARSSAEHATTWLACARMQLLADSRYSCCIALLSRQ